VLPIILIESARDWPIRLELAVGIGCSNVGEAQGCQIVLGPNIPNRKNIPNFHKRPLVIPNGRKIFQMIIKYNNSFHSKALQIFTKIGIFGLKTNHLAALVRQGRRMDPFSNPDSQSGSPLSLTSFVVTILLDSLAFSHLHIGQRIVKAQIEVIL
jgi:hypothetical protein